MYTYQTPDDMFFTGENFRRFIVCLLILCYKKQIFDHYSF